MLTVPKFNDPKILDDFRHRADMDRFMELSEKLFGMVYGSQVEGDRHICMHCGLRYYPKIIGRRRVSRFCTQRCAGAFRYRDRRD